MTRNKTSPLFTVVIPVFNGAATLPATLESAARQTLTALEILVVDDGSTDDTLNLIAEWQKRDPRIRILSAGHRGPSAARNLGIAQARGRYIAFLDADDLWPADRLSRVKQAFADYNDVAAIYGRVGFFRNDARKLDQMPALSCASLSVESLLATNPVVTLSNLVFERKALQRLGGFDEMMVHNEDIDLLSRALQNGLIISGVDVVLTFYRTGTNGLSANVEAMRRSWKLVAAHVQDSQLRLAEPIMRACEAAHLMFLARRALRAKTRASRALPLALAALATSPSGFWAHAPRNLRILGASLFAQVLPSRIINSLFS